VTVSEIVSLTASLGQLALALLCIARAGRSPLAAPLALFCLNVFCSSAAAFAYDRSHVESWTLLDHTLSPWGLPLALRFVLAFVGKRRAHRAVRTICSLACGVLSAISAGAFLFPGLRPLVTSPAWSAWFLSVTVPTMTFALLTLVRHQRDTEDATEQARTRLLLTSVAIGTVFGCVDELSFFRHSWIPLGDMGMLLITLPLAAMVVRFRLLEGDVSLRGAAWALAIASGLFLTAFLAFQYFEAGIAMLALASATVTLALAVASRSWLLEGSARRARQLQLATLGRFTAQMAHDLKNPLSALKGAGQLLAEDLRRATPGVDRAKFVDLMLAQIARLEGLVDVYGRLARVEPSREPLDLNETVRDVLALQSLANESLTVKTELGESLPPCRADRAMLTRVLENLVRNAMEAMPEGGTIRVRTASLSGANGTELEVAVEDTGCGMDARTRERAFDDFFTTKAQGSGLGLAFVGRVVQAHGGHVELSSRPGHGTVVSVRLPVG
jgi:signal transduction histidine kinase